MTNYILGNGLSAKIFAFYNREYKIIGKEKSVALSPIINNLVFLQNHPSNIKFLNDLQEITGIKLDIKIRKTKILMFKDNQYTPVISEAEKQLIIQKKLVNTEGEKLCFVHPIFKENVSLSEANPDSELEYIDISFKEIKDMLELVIISQYASTEEIININTADKIITDASNQKFVYDECITTLLAKDFYRLCSVNVEGLKTLSTTVIAGSEKTFGIPEIIAEGAIIYFPQSNFEFNKIVKRDGKCYAEICGDSKKFSGTTVQDTRLVKKDVLPHINDIVFLGRYAEWNPDLRIQDVVERSSRKIVMQKIWQDQKSFSSKFFNYEMESKNIQKNSKECCLLAINEVFDFLDKINWKLHQSEKKISLESLKNEWIDIFKYWLTLGTFYGFNYEDFLTFYKKRSEEVKKRFEVAK